MYYTDPAVRVDGVGSLFHHGSYYYTLTYDRCGHAATVEASRRELEQAVKTYYWTCQQCTRSLR